MAAHDFSPGSATVTGSDSGIGRPRAVAPAEAGLDMGITLYSGEDGANETARLVQGHGRRTVVSRFDTTDAPACGDVVDRLADEPGDRDVFWRGA